MACDSMGKIKGMFAKHPTMAKRYAKKHGAPKVDKGNAYTSALKGGK
jgi:hypothetical protein